MVECVYVDILQSGECGTVRYGQNEGDGVGDDGPACQGGIYRATAVSERSGLTYRDAAVRYQSRPGVVDHVQRVRSREEDNLADWGSDDGCSSHKMHHEELGDAAGVGCGNRVRGLVAGRGGGRDRTHRGTEAGLRSAWEIPVSKLGHSGPNAIGVKGLEEGA